MKFFRDPGTSEGAGGGFVVEVAAGVVELDRARGDKKTKRPERSVLADPGAGLLIEKQVDEREDGVGECRVGLGG